VAQPLPRSETDTTRCTGLDVVGADWLMLDDEGRLMTELGDTGPSGGPLLSDAVITEGN